MDDNRIIELFWSRSEEAISETQKKYGAYCRYIAKNDLGSDEDAEECVNDTYLKVWNSVPPARPQNFSAFIGTVARNLALNKLDFKNAKKRSTQTNLALSELEEVIPDSKKDPSDELALRDALNGFLSSLPRLTRMMFVRRYWYLSPIREIARDYGVSESRVKVTLMRTRNRLKEHLEKEGINI